MCKLSLALSSSGLSPRRTCWLTLLFLAFGFPHPLTGQLRFQPNDTIGALDSPAEEVFDSRTASALGPDGSTIVANSRFGEVRLFDPDGNFVAEFGREGAGPGEFRYVTNVCFRSGDSGIRTWDHELSRVTDWSREGAFVEDRRVDMSRQGHLSMFCHSGGELLFLGNLSDNGSLVHVLGPDGSADRSFAELLQIERPENPMLEGQLNQGAACELPGGEVIVALRAPMAFGRYDLEGTEKWVRQETTLPNPLDFMTVEPDRYEAGVYPMVTGVHCLTDEYFYLVITDWNEERRSGELRSTVDGDLISRQLLSVDRHPLALLSGDQNGRIAAISVPSPYPHYLTGTWHLEWPPE